MNTTKSAILEQPMQKRWNGRLERAKKFGRWMMLTASLAGCGAAHSHQKTIMMGDSGAVTVIILDRNQSDTSIVEMKNYISALNKILERLVHSTIDMSSLNDEELLFEGMLEMVQIGRTAQEVAREFVEKCNSALISEEVSSEEMESIINQYAFAHGLLRDAIVNFQDKMSELTNVGEIPASLGYPQIDIFSDF